MFSNLRFKLRADLGYEGTTCDIPIKKKPGTNLTPKQKLFNQEFNRKRYPVERTFAHLKNYLILANRFRGSLTNYNVVFKNIVGLYNLKFTG